MTQIMYSDYALAYIWSKKKIFVYSIYCLFIQSIEGGLNAYQGVPNGYVLLLCECVSVHVLLLQHADHGGGEAGVVQGRPHPCQAVAQYSGIKTLKIKYGLF